MTRRRRTKFIIVHCSATSPSSDIGADEIDDMHLRRGWSGIGYHQVIRRDGEIEFGRHFDESGAHVKGQNFRSVGVCLIGGVNENGTVDKETTGGGFQQIDSATDWVIPTASRTGSERVRAVATPPGDDWTSEAAVPGTWVDISTNPRWYLTDDEAVGLDTGNVTFQIDDGAGNVLTSGVYLCNATEL